MSPKWPIGFLMAGFLLNLIFSMDKMSWINAQQVAPIFLVLNPVTNGPIVWVQAMWKVITFDYPLFDGVWKLFQYGLMTVIGGGFIITLILNLVQGTGSALGGIFRVIGRR